MKLILAKIFLLLFLSNTYMFAGDDICSATVVVVNDELAIFDNEGNTNSFVDPPPFGGYFGPDTWIEFTMPTSPLYLTIEEITLLDPAIAIYEGPCNDPKLLYNVLDNNCNGDPSPALLIENLTPGITYFIRIWPQNGSQNGSFLLGLADFLTTIPNFEVYEDASVNGDCLTLTPQQGGQQGCAWYQVPINFNEPFIHTMTANFGFLDANGADGICLVYQTAGPDFCGGTGQGIGAGGMPNSAIFEFDTWQNGGLGDPAQDHASLNINGDMNHANSVNGPVSLGNIEDGVDHILSFEWNPIGNMYTLFFDGGVILTGSFDLITNCFGGDNLAYWGYTSATGGSTNLHVICPDVEDYFPSTIDYLEVEICEGQSYNGFTQSGYYTEFVNGPNGCLHQNNILLNVNDASPPNFIDTIICDGESVVVDNQVYTEAFLYFIDTQTEFGCDSSIILNLEVIELEVEFDEVPELSCDLDEILIGPSIVTNATEDQISYLWSQNNETTDSISVSSPGEYTVTIIVDIEGKVCQTFETITVVGQEEPTITELDDIFLECETSDSIFVLVNNSSTDNSIVNWTLDEVIVSTDSAIQVFNPGAYIFTLFDTITGCVAIDTVEVVASDEQPTIEIDGPDLDCDILQFIPDITVSSDVVEYNWFLDTTLVSTSEDFVINAAGTYILQVQNANGCSSQTQLVISQDTIAPVVDIGDGVILCDSSEVVVPTNLSSDFLYNLAGPEDLSFSLDSIVVSEIGEYILFVESPINNCIYIDTFQVSTLGNSPEISFASDTIDCNTSSFLLASITNESDLNYEWTSGGSVVSTDSLAMVQNSATYCLVVSTENGCTSKDSIIIIEDVLAPIVELSADTIDCINSSTVIAYANQVGYETVFSDEDGNEFYVDSLLVNQPAVFYVDVENTSNGCHSYDSIEVISNSVFPNFSLENGMLDCNVSELMLDFVINNNYDSLNWSGPMQFQSDEETPLINESGTYDIYVDLGAGCIIDTFIIITENFSLPDIDVEFDSITCDKPLAEIVFSSDDNTTVELMDPSGNLFPNVSNHTTDISGEYSAFLVGENGCMDSINFNLLSFTSPPPFDVSPGESITCLNEFSEFSASGNGDVVFMWTGPDGFSEEGPEVVISQAGLYELVVKDIYGCTADASFTVEAFLDPPNIDLTGGDLNCQLFETEVNVVSDGVDDAVEWRINGEFISDDSAITVSEGGFYHVEVTNEYGCVTTDSIEVLENTEKPEIIPISETEIVFFPTDNEKDISIELNSSVDYALTWIPEEAVSCSNCENPTLFDPTIDSLAVIVVNIFGCADTLVFKIRSEFLPQVWIPNVFTPNDDGNNDFFTLFANNEIEEIETMLIYDRWGNRVEEKNNILPNNSQLGWNGKFNELNVMEGVYAYYFKVITIDGEELEYVGDVTVVR